MPRFFVHPWLSPLLLGLITLAIRLLYLDKPAHFDELYHLLAAQSWLVDGELRIAEGTYNRTALFTIMLSGWIAALGDSLVVVRLPSVLAGSALVVAVFVWVRNEVSLRAAWLAGLLLALWPDGIQISQFARFYALQGLLFWLGAIAVYHLVKSFGKQRAVLLAVAAAGTLGAALYLQVVTAIGFLGLALWSTLALAQRWRRPLGPSPVVTVIGGGLVLAGLGLLLFQMDFVGNLISSYRSAPLWNARRLNDFWFYHGVFSMNYQIFWPFTIFAVMVSFPSYPRQVGFCVSVFAVAFFLHSFAGAKHIRYFYYVVPFLFVIWSIALSELWPTLKTFFDRLLERIVFRLPFRPALGRRLVQASLGLAVVFAVASNLAVARTVAFTFDVVLPPMQRAEDWAAARVALGERRLERASVVLTTSELESLYYLGRYDILVSKSRMHEVAGKNEFARDNRTGRPVISSPESMIRVMTCYPDGLLVSSDWRWRNPSQLDDSVANVVVGKAERIDLPAASRMRAYAWQNSPGPRPPATMCAGLPRMSMESLARP